MAAMKPHKTASRPIFTIQDGYHDPAWFPPGLEKLKNLENWEGIFQSGNFVKDSKYWKNQKKICWKTEKKYWKGQGNLSASNSENPTNMVLYFK